jgi:hypothetical protein
VEYSVGFSIKNAAAISTIARLPARSWTPAVTPTERFVSTPMLPRSWKPSRAV